MKKTKYFSTAALALALVVTGVNAYHTAPAKKKILKKNRYESYYSPGTVAIEKIEYDFAKADIRDNYYAGLDQLASTIIEEKYAISLRGHADSIGSYVANWKLSDKRALEVKAYLVKKGVAEQRVVTTPYGSTEPIASNTTAAGRQKNRRVEIKLRKLDE